MGDHRLCAAAILAAAIALAPPLAALGREDAPGDPGGSEQGVSSELLREIEEAARLEREYRAEREAAAAREQAAREAARVEKARQKRERERASEQIYQAEIAEQQRIQADLLWAATGRGKPRSPEQRTVITGPAPLPTEELDVRIAAAAPVDRELPVEIFDLSKARIAPGVWGNREPLEVSKQVLDADGDGKPELVRYVDVASQRMLRQEEDRNYDGITDAWSEYASGGIVARVLDSNDDGNPDVWERYRDGRLSTREVDRDDDGVRDVFYRYRGDSLREERHDADNDGIVDLVITYEQRLRVRAEEDVDRNGRMDTWTSYVAREGAEQVSSIERDRQDRGFADTFEFFGSAAGRAVLLRREEDINGDGEIDVVSFYVDGKLRKRQISDDRLAAEER